MRVLVYEYVYVNMCIRISKISYDVVMKERDTIATSRNMSLWPNPERDIISKVTLQTGHHRQFAVHYDSNFASFSRYSN